MTSVAQNADVRQQSTQLNRDHVIVFVVMAVGMVLLPWSGIYPFFIMQALCFALFACAFNLLIGYGGLLSFGHAMFLGGAGDVSAYLAKEGLAIPALGIALPPFTPELAILLGALAAGVLGVVV